MNVNELQSILDTFLEVKVEPSKTLIVKETLTRLGVSPRGKTILYQSCHLLSLYGKTYITHFKELFLLDGKESTLDETDKNRRNQIAKLLEDWGLLTIASPDKFPVQDHYMKLLKIVSSKEKSHWRLVAKYHLGFYNPNHKPYSSLASVFDNHDDEDDENSKWNR